MSHLAGEDAVSRIEVAPCGKCKTDKHVTVEATGGPFLMVVCHNCYDADCVGDPARFVSGSITGIGATRDEAVADWNFLQEEAAL